MDIMNQAAPTEEEITEVSDCMTIGQHLRAIAECYDVDVTDEDIREVLNPAIADALGRVESEEPR